MSKASIAEAGLLGAQIMSATSELRGKSDTELNMKVARKLADLSKRAAILKGSSMKKAQAAIYLIAKQLNSDEIGTVVLALDLVDVVMKHSNSETYNLLANDRNYMAMLKELCMTQRKGINVISHFTPDFVQRKTLIMVQRWGIELSPMTIVRSSRDDAEAQTSRRVSAKQRRLIKAGKKFVDMYAELKQMKDVIFPHPHSRDSKNESSVIAVGMSNATTSQNEKKKKKKKSRRRRNAAEKEEKTVSCIGGCGFEMPESHLTKMCSKCSKRTIERLKESIPGGLSERACRGGCGFMLPLQHKTGKCWACSSRDSSSSSSLTRNATASSEKKDGDDDVFFPLNESTPKDDENVFNFFDSPVQSSPTEESQHQIDPFENFQDLISNDKHQKAGGESSSSNSSSAMNNLFDSLRL